MLGKNTNEKEKKLSQNLLPDLEEIPFSHQEKVINH